MTDWFFYQERGQTMGPVTVDQLRSRVGDGTLRAFDLIYKEGEAGWKMAMEHADLREAFRGAGQNPTTGRPWVCLRRKGEDSFDFVTDGPYSDDEIRTALASGRLGYADYVWRNEFSEWQRIGSVETFNPRARATGRSAPEPSADELLKNVVELRRERHVTPVVEAPPEAEGDDLTDPRRAARPAPPSEEETRIIMRRPLPPPEETDPSVRPPPPPPSSLTNKSNAATGTQTKAARAATAAANAAAVTVMVGAKRPAPSSADEPADPPPTRAGSTKTSATKSAKTRTKPTNPGARQRAESRTPRDEAGPAIFTERRKKRRGPSVWSDWGIVIALVAVALLGATYLIGSRLARGRAGTPADVARLPLPLPTVPVTPPRSVGAAATATSAAPMPASGGSPNAGADLAPSVSDGLAETGLTTEPVGVEDVPPEEIVVQPEPAPKPVEPVPAARAPTELKLSVNVTGAGKARIDLRTNGGPETPVYLQVIGAAGQVADGPAYYRFLKLAGTGSLGAPIDVSGVDLPAGRFRFVAESGGLKRAATLNLGVGESKYRQAIGRQRKLGAAALWQERLSLYRVAQSVLQAVQQNGVGRKLGPRAFATLDQIRKSTGGQYLYYEDWAELKAIVDDGRVRITNDVLVRARRARERVAAMSLWRPTSG